MNVPVRCYTCGRVLASYVHKMTEALKMGEKGKSILLALGIPPHRVCCRRMLLTYVAGTNK